MVDCSFLELVCDRIVAAKLWRANRAPELAGPVRLLLGGEDSPADFARYLSHRGTKNAEETRTGNGRS
jgi:hypothetical protein